MSTNSYYVALNASNLRYSNFGERLKYHEVNKFGNLPINNKCQKMLILHLISGNSHTCGSDAKMFVGYLRGNFNSVP